MTTKLKVMLAALSVILVADQLSKLWVASVLPITPAAEIDRITVIEGFFYITHARNTGAAFGLLVDWSPLARALAFAAAGALTLMVIISFYRGLAPRDRFNACALGLIVGGAGGNLIDRVLRGEVIDFLHFRLWGDLVWPDFNIADTAIVLGVTALILDLLASEGASRSEEQALGEATKRDEGKHP